MPREIFLRKHGPGKKHGRSKNLVELTRNGKTTNRRGLARFKQFRSHGNQFGAAGGE